MRSGAEEQAVVGLVVGIVAGVVGAALVTGIVLYAIDFRIDATIEQTRCAQGEVDVKTKLFGIDHTVRGVTGDVCGVLQPGNHVEYRIRSQRTTLYEAEGGDCLYDSETGAYCGRDPGFALPAL